MEEEEEESKMLINCGKSLKMDGVEQVVRGGGLSISRL